MKIKQFCMLLFLTSLLTSCGAAKEHKNEIYQVCDKDARALESDYYVGVGEGSSINAQYSRELAMEKAREIIAGKMNVFVEKIIETESESSADPTSFKENRQAKAKQYIAQRLGGLTTFCSKTYKNKEGIYTSFLGCKLDIPRKQFLSKLKEDLEL